MSAKDGLQSGGQLGARMSGLCVSRRLWLMFERSAVLVGRRNQACPFFADMLVNVAALHLLRSNSFLKDTRKTSTEGDLFKNFKSTIC